MDGLDGAVLDCAEQDFHFGRTTEDQRGSFRRCAFTPGAHLSQVAVQKSRRAEEANLKQPIQKDRQLAEEEPAKSIRRHEKIVEHEERQAENRRRPRDHRQIHQRDEPPLGSVGPYKEEDDRGVDSEIRQDGEKK